MAVFGDYEAAISTKLQPLRNVLSTGNIPVIPLPKEAAKFAQMMPGSLRVLVGHIYRGLQSNTIGQAREVDASIFIRLPNRYDDQPEATRLPALEWVENEVIKQLLGFLLPGAASELLLKNGRLLPPEEGEWQRELTFTFSEYLFYSQESTPTLSGATIAEVKFLVD